MSRKHHHFFSLLACFFSLTFVACQALTDDGDGGASIEDGGPNLDGGTMDGGTDLDGGGPVTCDPATRPQEKACGLNGRGNQSYSCEGTDWVLGSSCSDQDLCVDGVIETLTCGPNSAGALVKTCMNGQWTGECVGAGVCINGRTQKGATPCGYAGFYQELCANGIWETTATCMEAHADDPALLAGEADQSLSFVCSNPALDWQGIVDRFPEGAYLWTPGSIRPQSNLTLSLTHYSRSCTQLSGCSQWNYYIGSRDNFYLGYSVGADGQLFLWQANADLPNTDETLLPIEGGIATATLATNSTNFDEPQRFLVKVAPNCLSVSSLITKRPPDANGNWGESVYGTLVQWSWNPNLPRSPPDPLPTISPDPAPYLPSTIPEIAAGWFPPGASTWMGRPIWDLNQVRDCTPFTGCTPWQRASNTVPITLEVAGFDILLTLRGRSFTLASDGSFADDRFHGFVMPSALHLWENGVDPSPVPMAGGMEVAREAVIYP